MLVSIVFYVEYIDREFDFELLYVFICIRDYSSLVGMRFGIIKISVYIGDKDLFFLVVVYFGEV